MNPQSTEEPIANESMGDLGMLAGLSFAGVVAGMIVIVFIFLVGHQLLSLWVRHYGQDTRIGEKFRARWPDTVT